MLLRIFYFLYQWLIFFPLLFISTALAALFTIVGCFIGNSKFWGYYPAALWCRIVCFLALIKIKVTGKENVDKNTSYIFVANHQGTFDIFLIYGYLGNNFRWMMKKSLQYMPFAGQACVAAGHIFVDRKSRAGIVESLKKAKSQLKNGISTVIFPEGTRTKDGKMHAFKKGAFQIALELKLPIVPLTIDGSYNIMKRGAWMLNFGKMSLTIHPPVSTENLSQENMPELMDSVWNTIAEPLGESKK